MALVSKNFADIVTFTRASTATYRDSTGTRQTAAINAPRLDYSAAGVPLGLLIEEQRTNFFLNSGTPATQTITLSTTGSYTLWIEGTGSIAVAAGTATGSGFGTATAGTPVTFSISAGGTVTCTVTGTPTIAQVENGAFATSYIPTTSAQVTRSADVATINTLSPWFNAVTGSIYVEADIAAAPSAGKPVFRVDDTAGTNAIDARFRPSALGAVITGTAGFSAGTFTANTTQKMALAYAVNDFAFSANGAAASTIASGAVPSGINLARLGSDGSAYLNGHIRKIVYYPARKTNAELATLTT